MPFHVKTPRKTKLAHACLKQLAQSLFVLLFSWAAPLHAQEIREINGRVTDQAAKPLPHVTVEILSEENKRVSATSTDEKGKFSFPGTFSVRFSMMLSRTGLQSQRLTLKALSANRTANGFVLKMKELSQNLKEVSVSAQKNLIERKSGKTIVNVEQDLMATGSSALELLEKSPDIQLDENNNITLKGKTSVRILIDGKPSYLSDDQLTKMLKNMPGSSIASFEIISQPGAQYEAAGNGGIINIKTKIKRKKGLNADLTVGLGLGSSLRHNDNLNLNYNLGKFNIYALYSFSNTPNIWKLWAQRKVSDRGKITVFDISSIFHEFETDHLIKGGVDYVASSRQTIGFSVTRDIDHVPGYQNTNSLYTNQAMQTDSVLRTNVSYPGRYLSTSWSLNYRNLLDTSGRELTASADLANYHNQDFSQVAGSFFSPDGLALGATSGFRNYLPSNVLIRAVKLDFTSPLNPHMKWSTGLKFSRVATDNSTRVDTLIPGGYANDPGQGNSYSYTENILAAYGSLSQSGKTTDWQFGLRLEQTFSRGLSSYQSSDLRKHYLDFFPSLSVSQKLDDANQLDFSFARRIDRPSYGDLNPFKFYIDKNSFGLGNPFLKSQYTNGVELSHTYRQKLITTLNLSWTRDYQSFVIRTDSASRSAFRRPENINHRFVASLGVSLPLVVLPGWTLLCSGGVLYSEFQADSSVVGIAIFKSKFSFNLNVNNTLSLPLGLKMEVSGFVYSGSNLGLTTLRPRYMMSAGVKKSLFSGKGDLKLAVQDIFNVNEFQGYQIYGSTNRVFTRKPETRFGTLSFSYRLGNKPKTARHESGAADEQERVSKPGN